MSVIVVVPDKSLMPRRGSLKNGEGGYCFVFSCFLVFCLMLWGFSMFLFDFGVFVLLGRGF